MGSRTSFRGDTKNGASYFGSLKTYDMVVNRKPDMFFVVPKQTPMEN